MIALHHKAPETPRYLVDPGSQGQWRIVDRDAGTVDICHSGSFALYAAGELNAGRAVINRHAIVGSRVMPI